MKMECDIDSIAFKKAIRCTEKLSSSREGDVSVGGHVLRVEASCAGSRCQSVY